MHICPEQPSDKQLYDSLSYLLGDLAETERLSREPKGEVGKGIKYLDNYKNPCWLEELPFQPFKYPMTKWKHMVQPKHLQAVSKAMMPILRKRSRSANRTGARLRCLPYIILAGMHKAGTSDFYESLTKHDMVEEVPMKEPQFWSHLPQGTKLSDYLDFYDLASEQIRRFTDKSDFHPKVTLDGSTHTYQSYPGTWRKHPWNKQTGKQCITLPQHLKYLTPKSKVIFLFRKPQDWVVSCINFFKSQYIRRGIFGIGNRPNQTAFQHKITRDIGAIDKCISDHNDTLWCVYTLAGTERCHVAHTMYYLWSKLWVDGFGRDNLLFLNADVYFKDRGNAMQRAFEFLGLPEMSNNSYRLMLHRRVKNKSKTEYKVEMDTVSAEKLSRLVTPWNKLLAEYLNDDSFLWQS